VTLYRQLNAEDTRERLPDVPWREIRGFRNIAVHAYFSLDWDVVHEVATVNLPDIEPRVLAVLRAEAPEIAAKFGTDVENVTGKDGPGSETGSH
jgi:hypothetical protein